MPHTARIAVDVPSDPAAIEEYLIMRDGRVAYRVTTYPAALEPVDPAEIDVVQVPARCNLRLLP